MYFDDGAYNAARFRPSSAALSASKRQAVKARRIAFENLELRRIADVLSLFHFVYDEGLAIAVRHVRAEDHVVLADEILRARITEGAAPSAERFSPERIYGRLEEILISAVG